MIRRANNKDCDIIFSLQHNSFGTEKWDKSLIEKDLEDPTKQYYVIEDDGVVGYVSYLVVAEQADLMQIVVDTTRRGKGYGRQLIEYTIAELKQQGVEKIFLEVRRSNCAQEFYKKIGFQSISVRKQYYGEEDGIVYLYEIK